MLTLQNFEAQINPIILKRGKDYYDQGYVAYIEETKNGAWTAQIEGSETYTVETTITKGEEISDYSCDCPYDGETCKHVVAMFFALRQLVKKVESSPKKVAKKDVFETLLQSVSVKELQGFIKEQAAKDKNFKTAFELFFADKDSRVDVQEKYTSLVKQLIRKHTSRGFIEYKASSALAKEVEGILATGYGYANKTNFRDAFALAKAVLRPMMEAQADCDDSHGRMGGCVENAIQLLETIASADSAAINIKEQLFSFLQTELNDTLYFDFGDFGYELFSVFRNLAVQLNQPEIFLSFIDAQLPKHIGQYDNYKKEFFQKSKIAFLHQTGKLQEAEDLVHQNMDIVEIRMAELEKAIAKKNFGHAKQLINDGIKVAEGKAQPGTVNQWRKQLLRIAVMEKDTLTIRKYTKYFAFDGSFSAEYYQQWKATFTNVEWATEIEQHIKLVTERITNEWQKSNPKSWRPTAHPPLLYSLAPIYIQEKYWERLLTLVQQANELNTTLAYHSWLSQFYPQELLAIYLPALEKYGIESNGRSEYADLVEKMKKIMKDIPEGKLRILNLAKRLREKFSIKPRRPAMLEELDKILKGV